MLKRNILVNALYLLLTIGLTVGVLTVFSPCGPKDDGSFMNCHWASVTVAAAGGVMIVQSLLHTLLTGSSARLGISASIIPAAVFTMLIPQTLVHMCIMPSMRCQAVMKPSVFVISALIAVVAAVDIIIRAAEIKREKKQ